jgi:hypothetical protein
VAEHEQQQQGIERAVVAHVRHPHVNGDERTEQQARCSLQHPHPDRRHAESAAEDSPDREVLIESFFHFRLPHKWEIYRRA